MTKFRYYLWALKHKAKIRRQCKKCGVVKSHSGDICLICGEKLQKEIDDMKAKVRSK